MPGASVEGSWTLLPLGHHVHVERKVQGAPRKHVVDHAHKPAAAAAEGKGIPLREGPDEVRHFAAGVARGGRARSSSAATHHSPLRDPVFASSTTIASSCLCVHARASNKSCSAMLGVSWRRSSSIGSDGSLAGRVSRRNRPSREPLAPSSWSRGKQGRGVGERGGTIARRAPQPPLPPPPPSHGVGQRPSHGP